MNALNNRSHSGANPVSVMHSRTGFLVKTFPRLSETFILNEILGLEQLGWSLHIYSLKRPAVEPVQPGVAQVLAPITYVPSLLPTTSWKDSLRVVAAHASLIVRRPFRYLSAFYKYFWGTRQGRLKEFAQAGYLAVSLEEAGITHLHAHFANAPTAVAEIVFWLTGIPYSFTAHAKDIYTSNQKDLTRRVENATAVLTCTGFNQNHLHSLVPSGTPISLAYHGIDTTRFTAIGSVCSRDGRQEVPMILSVGRFCEKKGLDDLIYACGILRDNGVSFRCVMVGYGPLEGELRRLRSELRLEEQISMPGKLAQPEVIDYYNTASVFALPCVVTDSGDRDGIPNVLMEAMAAGVPVVTTNVSGITELVQQDMSGWLVEPHRPDMLAAFLQYVLSHPDEAAMLATEARRRVIEDFGLRVSAYRVHLHLLSAIQAGLARDEGRAILPRLSKERRA